MLKHLLAVLLLVSVACQPASPSLLTPEYKMVVSGVDKFDDARDPRWKPFYRDGDEMKLTGAIYTLVSGSGAMCIAPMRVWSMTPVGTLVTCEWRTRRSIHGVPPIFRS